MVQRSGIDDRTPQRAQNPIHDHKAWKATRYEIQRAEERDDPTRAVMKTKSAPDPKLAKYRTSKRINFATDEWGNDPNVTHLEIQWGKHTLRIEITEEKIHVNVFGEFNQTAVNALEITKLPEP